MISVSLTNDSNFVEREQRFFFNFNHGIIDLHLPNYCNYFHLIHLYHLAGEQVIYVFTIISFYTDPVYLFRFWIED